MRFRKLLITGLVFLSGCGFTPEGEAFRSAIRSYGAQAADKQIEAAEWFLCNGVTVGAARRRYGEKPVKLQAYWALCHDNIVTPTFVPDAKDKEIAS